MVYVSVSRPIAAGGLCGVGVEGWQITAIDSMSTVNATAYAICVK
jgi:hypothetical protein